MHHLASDWHLRGGLAKRDLLWEEPAPTPEGIEIWFGKYCVCWCPREDSNLRPQDSYHFSFHRHARRHVRGLDCLFTMARKPRCRPYSLYTFLPARRKAWLGIGTIKMIRAFPEFERIHHAVSHHGAQFKTLGILCSILLSYADKQGDRISVTVPLQPPPTTSGSGRRREFSIPASTTPEKPGKREPSTDISLEMKITCPVYAISTFSG